MDSLVLALLALAVVFGVGAVLYRWGMARRSELLGDLDPDAPDDSEVFDDVDEVELPEIGAPAGAPVRASGRSTEERLAELDELLGKGLITPAEHHEQRTVILRSI